VTSPMPHPTRSGLKVIAVGLLLILAPVLYVASFLPATWLNFGGLLPDRIYGPSYEPIRFAARHSPTMRRPVELCLDWCNRQWPYDPVGSGPLAAESAIHPPLPNP
jgi:hypothetical protein